MQWLNTDREIESAERTQAAQTRPSARAPRASGSRCARARPRPPRTSPGSGSPLRPGPWPTARPRGGPRSTGLQPDASRQGVACGTGGRVSPARPRQDVRTYSVFKFFSLRNAPGWISLILLKRRSLWRNRRPTQGASETRPHDPPPVNRLRLRLLNTGIYRGDGPAMSPYRGLFQRLLWRDGDYVNRPPTRRPPTQRTRGRLRRRCHGWTCTCSCARRRPHEPGAGRHRAPARNHAACSARVGKTRPGPGPRPAAAGRGV